MSSRGETAARPRLTALAAASRRALPALPACLATLLAGLGWLYVLRGLGWLAIGPRVGDSLPLLQLAGFAGQPLGRVVAAWLVAGAVAGAVLVRMPRLRRGVLAGLLGLIVLLAASQASFAVARNLRLGSVLWSHSPGVGPWLAAALFAVGCALPGRFAGDRGLGTRLAPH